MYVCVCKAVTDSQIKTAINQGVCSRKQLFDCFGVGKDCGKCNKHLKALLDENQPLMRSAAANQVVLNA